MVNPQKRGDFYLETSQSFIQDSFPDLMRCSSSAQAGQHVRVFVCKLYMWACSHLSAWAAVIWGQPLKSLLHLEDSGNSSGTLKRERSQPPGPETSDILSLNSEHKKNDSKIQTFSFFQIMQRNNYIPDSWAFAFVIRQTLLWCAYFELKLEKHCILKEKKKTTLQSSLLIWIYNPSRGHAITEQPSQLLNVPVHLVLTALEKPK